MKQITMIAAYKYNKTNLSKINAALRPLAAGLTLALTAGLFVEPSLAQTAAAQISAQTQTAECETDAGSTAQGFTQPRSFTKKRYNIKGHWEIIDNCGRKTIQFSEDFKTKGGPDLRVYLSPFHIKDLDNKNAADQALQISVLHSKKGAQSYSLPGDIDLSDYKSLIIHCEAFSVFWGGADL